MLVGSTNCIHIKIGSMRSNNQLITEDAWIVEREIIRLSKNIVDINTIVFEENKDVDYYEDIFRNLELDQESIDNGLSPKKKYSILYDGIFDYSVYATLLKKTSFRKTFIRDIYFWPLISACLIAYLALTKGYLYFIFLLVIPFGFFSSAFGFLAILGLGLLTYSVIRLFQSDSTLFCIILAWLITHSSIINLKIDHKKFIQQLCSNSEVCMRFFRNYLKRINIVEKDFVNHNTTKNAYK